MNVTIFAFIANAVLAAKGAIEAMESGRAQIRS